MFIALRDDHGAALEYVAVGLGWDPVRRKWFGRRGTDIDLNVAALLFGGDRLVDVVYHERLTSEDGAVRHHGDSMTGEGKGDNEIITVDLLRLAVEVKTVVFLVTCYSGQPFTRTRNAFCRLIDGTAGTELARYELSGLPHTGLVMGALDRLNGIWQFRVINEGIDARHPVEAAPRLGQYVR